MGTQKKFKLLMIEDDLLQKSTFKELIELKKLPFEIVGTGSTEEEALKLVKERKPDLILMDLTLRNGGSGIETTRKIRLTNPEVGILVLTGHRDDQVMTSALKAGANAYQVKDASSFDETCQNLIKIAEKRVVLTSYQNTRLIEAMRNPEGVITLTNRERQVLMLYAVGFTRKQVGVRLKVVEGTVRNITEKILDKLDCPRVGPAALKAEKLLLIPEIKEIDPNSEFFNKLIE